MSPSPTVRATSTSRFGSIVYDARPSTSDGAMPASSSASETAWHASDSSVSGRPLPSVVWPMPTTAVLSLMSRRRRAHQPFHSGVRRSRNDATPSPESCGRGVELDEHRLFFEEVAARELRRVVQQLLRPADRLGRAAREPLGPLLRGRLQLGGGHDLVDDAEAFRVGGGEVVAEEDRAPSPCACRRRAAAGTRRRRRGSSPRRTNTWMILAVSAAITRSAASTNIEPPPAAVPLSATMTGFSQSCIACISCWKPRRIMCVAPPDDHVGRAVGLRLARGLADREVGAGAEVPLARAGEHDRAHVEVAVRVPEVLRSSRSRT